MPVTTDYDTQAYLDELKKKPDPVGRPIVGPQYGQAHPALSEAIGTPIAPQQQVTPTASPTNLLGTPPAPPADKGIGGQILPAAMPPPDVSGGPAPAPQTPPMNGAGAIGEPIAPRPQGKALADWQAQDLAKHPAGQPRYHGIGRVMDTIAGATNIGSAIERGGEFGTQGAEAKQARLAGGAALENKQIEEGEKERQANALAEEEAQKTETEKTGSELVDVTLPDGTHQQVMRKNLASPTAAIITGASRENVAGTNATSRENVAGINATSRENTANIRAGAARQPIRVMGNSTYERQQDGSWKEIGPAPPRAEPGNYSPVNDENGGTVAWVDPKSGHMVRVDEIQGMGGAAPGGVIPPKPSGQERSRMGQAEVVTRAGDGLIADIKANRNKLGNMQAIIESAILGTPWSDPETSQLRAEIASFAALNPAMHGFRGTDALREFEKLLGGIPNNPDSLIAAIQGIQKTAGAFKAPTAQGGGTVNMKAPDGTVRPVPQNQVDHYKSKGAVIVQ